MPMDTKGREKTPEICVRKDILVGSAGSDSRVATHRIFMKLLTFFRERRIPVACLHNPVVTLPNDDVHELDVFSLVDNRIPLCIECKTGEFRWNIDKYTRLVKRLNLEKEQFLVCATGLDEKQVQGFNSMYGVTFTNETNFLEHVQRVAA